MYKIALMCEHGASTGLVVKKMIEAAKQKEIEVDIVAYSATQLVNIIEDKDFILLGPQLAFKKAGFQQEFPDYADKIAVVNTMDFGMMDGEKILNDVIALIEK